MHETKAQQLMAAFTEITSNVPGLRGLRFSVV